MPTLQQLITQAHQAVPGILPDDLYDRAAMRKVLIVDVREAEEMGTGSIPGAIGIPRGLIEMAADTAFRGHHRILSMARNRTVCCVCDCPSAGRASLAAWALQRLDFSDVLFLKGGIPLWVADGYPLRPLIAPAYSVRRKP